MSVADTAKYLSISRARLYELLKAGDLRPAKIGHRTVIWRVDADAFLERSLVGRRTAQTPNVTSAAGGGIFG
ncbi:helix-turn-helix domain-containing protein [Rhizobium sp.]|uniref:helix-turn-helix domain-containing protein n=1 Tax=Rhizobium sp. TaxID=391 RepID=UPI0039181C63